MTDMIFSNLVASPDLIELSIEKLEDAELVDLILKRSNEKEIEVSIDDL